STLVGWAGSRMTCFEVYLNRLYFGQAGSAVLGKWDGSTTSVAATAAAPIYTLRTHFRQAAQYLYLGVGVAGVNGVGRIWSWDGSTLRVLRELGALGAPYSGQVRGLVAWRGALWVGIQQAGGLALLRYDPVGSRQLAPSGAEGAVGSRQSAVGSGGWS